MVLTSCAIIFAKGPGPSPTGSIPSGASADFISGSFMSIRTTSDAGTPVVVSEPDGPHAAIYRAIGTKVRDALQGAIAAA